MDKDKVLPEGIVGMGATDTMVEDMDMDIVDEVDNVDDGVHEQRKLDDEHAPDELLDDEHAPDELLDEAEPRQGQELLLELQCKFKP